MLAKRRRTPTLAASRRRSADAELWRPCEPDLVRGPGTKSGSCGYFALPISVVIVHSHLGRAESENSRDEWRAFRRIV